MNPVGQGLNPRSSACQLCDTAEGFKCPGASVSSYVRRADSGTFSAGPLRGLGELSEVQL